MSPGPLDPITMQSFAIIDAELAELGIRLPVEQYPLVRRAIHSTADFTLARSLCFHPLAVKAGVAALQSAAPIVVDVNMVAAGVDRRRLEALGSRLLCRVADSDVAARSREARQTRSAAGMRAALLEAGAGAIVAVGNAPTALREVLWLVDQELVRPALLVGVPVGFVDAVESKAALMERDDVPWIAVEGRRGGSPVAVALVNALLHLALPEVPA